MSCGNPRAIAKIYYPIEFCDFLVFPGVKLHVIVIFIAA